MIAPEDLTLINPATGLAPNEVVCILCHLTYHVPLGACPNCPEEIAP